MLMLVTFLLNELEQVWREERKRVKIRKERSDKAADSLLVLLPFTRPSTFDSGRQITLKRATEPAPCCTVLQLSRSPSVQAPHRLQDIGLPLSPLLLSSPRFSVGCSLPTTSMQAPLQRPPPARLHGEDEPNRGRTNAWGSSTPLGALRNPSKEPQSTAARANGHEQQDKKSSKGERCSAAATGRAISPHLRRRRDS